LHISSNRASAQWLAHLFHRIVVAVQITSHDLLLTLKPPRKPDDRCAYGK